MLCLTAAAFITGVCLLVAGIVFLVASPLDSGLMFGIAIAGIGVGLLGAVLLYAILAMFLPFLWRSMKKAEHGFHVNGRRSEGYEKIH